MGWKIESFLIAVCFAIWAFCAMRSTPVYGARTASFLQMLGYAALLIVMGFGRSDLAKFRGSARWYGVAATVAVVVAAYWLFTLVARLTPEQAAVAYVISGTYPLINAIMAHVIVKPLERRDWAGILIVTIGLAVLGWPKK